MSHLEKELELIGSEAPDELQINTVMQQPHNKTQKNPNQPATTAKSHVTIETSAVNSKTKKTTAKSRQIVPAITIRKIVVNQTLTPNFLTIPTQAKQIIKKQKIWTCLPTL